MRDFRLRTDLDRGVISGFALPLGLEPATMGPPQPGYSIEYHAGEGDDPDTYTFQVVVSHERLAAIVDRCLDLLPDEVHAIVEIPSYDAYRSVDVYLSTDPVPVEHFRSVWKHFEAFLLEDTSVGAGANAEEPFIEVFVDQWKRLVVHVPLDMRDEIEAMLQSHGLDEVPMTWPEVASDDEAPQCRSVLDVSDDQSPDLDEVLLQLRESLGLELNIDPESNLDEADRELGYTLWNCVVIVTSATEPEKAGAYISLWLTADCLAEVERLVAAEIDRRPEWQFDVVYTVDRVAHDERPEELGPLPPRPSRSEVLLVKVEPWGDAPAQGGATQEVGG